MPTGVSRAQVGDGPRPPLHPSSPLLRGMTPPAHRRQGKRDVHWKSSAFSLFALVAFGEGGVRCGGIASR